MTAHILVVIDDLAQRRQIKASIEGQGHVVEFADSGTAAVELLRHRRQAIKTIFLDLDAVDMDHGDFFAALVSIDVDVPVVVQTDQDSIDAAVDVMRIGAFDFVVKPATQERITNSLSNALKAQKGEDRGRISRRSRTGNISLNEITAVSASMERVIDLSRRAAQSAIPVVLEGEAGVGKHMVARAIHSAGERASKPFITVSCDAVRPEAIEALLFGPKSAGAQGEGFAGGKFHAAEGGTLFLDEIGSLPLDAQARLLRAMEEGDVETGGAAGRRKGDVRLISATRKNLIEEVKLGRFREDLYYRLNVYPITIPALHRRKEDIPFLARAFVERFSHEQRLGKPLTINPAALALLTSADWPGNVRELENAIFRAVILASGPELKESDFPQVSSTAGAEPAPVAMRNEIRSRMSTFGETRNRAQKEITPKEAPVDHEPVLADNVIVSTDDSGDVRKLSDVEEELIRFALKFYRGQMSQVARKLGIGRSTLYRKLKDYGIDPENPQDKAA